MFKRLLKQLYLSSQHKVSCCAKHSQSQGRVKHSQGQSCVKQSQGVTADATDSTTAGVDTRLKSTETLQNEFARLTIQQLQTIIAAYNHLLPTIYKQEELLQYAPESSLYAVFDINSYVQREFYIDEMMVRCGNAKTKAMMQTLQPIDEIIAKALEPSNDLAYKHILTSKKRHRSLVFGNNAMHAMKFGQPLVVDCSFEDTMQNRSLESYKTQIFHLLSNNDTSPNPFHLHLCNLTSDSVLHTEQSHGPTVHSVIDQTFATTTDQCFTSLFDRKDLVMLSPDAPLYMEKFSNEKVYIIGGIVDLADCTPLTLSKAEKLGIECRKLPLDVYIRWAAGSGKRLTLTSVLSIISKLALGSDWSDAILQSLPKRLVTPVARPDILAHREAHAKKLRKSVERNKQHMVDDLGIYYRRYLTGKMSASNFEKKSRNVKKLIGKDPDLNLGRTLN